MNTILDVLLLRRPKINYVSPPVCEVIFSTTAQPIIVLESLSRIRPPSGLRAGGIGHFTLSWNAYPGALCYSVYKATTSDPFGPYELVSECTSDTSIDLTAFGLGCYRVSVITRDGESDLSDPICEIGISAPSVMTKDATGINVTTAILNGEATPNGIATDAFFEWGLTTGYGNTTANQSVGSGGSAVPFSQIITGLTGGTVYHFRAVAQNADGIAHGEDKSFTTLSPPPPSSNIDVVALNPIDDMSENGVVSGVF